MSLDLTSLIFGLAIATVLWWVIARAAPLGRQVAQDWRARREATGERPMSDLELEHRRATLRKAQSMHLAAPLFALQEVVEEPTLVAPPARVEPDGQVASEDAVTMTVPYLPAWPELAAAYEAPTLSMGAALAGGAHLVIIGQPGMGKTVALAHLATLAANRNEELGQLREHVPFFHHVSEVLQPGNERRPAIRLLLDLAHESIGDFEVRKVDGFVYSCFRSGRALLLMDGFDELTEEGQQEITGFVTQILAEYPRIRVVITGAPEYLDGITALGFAPLAISAWNRRRRLRFVRRWASLWSGTLLTAHASPVPAESPDPLVFSCWLDFDSRHFTPLELTLKAWAACAGDWQGVGSMDAISAHVRRLAPTSIPPAALEALAMQVILTAQPMFDPRKARDWVKEFELPEEVADEANELQQDLDDSATEGPKTAEGARRSRVGLTTPGLLGKLASSGLLQPLPGGKMRFVHPVLGCYLAGRALSGFKAEETLLNQPDWIGKLLCMRYFAAHGDASKLIDNMLQWSRLPMFRPTLTVARWLRDAPLAMPWRARVLAALGEVLQRPGLPLALRGQALAALIVSDDPTAGMLFRRLTGADAPELMQLCALGAGAVADHKAIPALKGALLSSHVTARRAACLALVAIGSNDALEVVGHALLRGDDDLRRSAAEALANDRGEGHAMLKDGAGMADIPLRRAVAYGLGRINEPWTSEILEKMRLEDDQWIVRNAASEMVETKARAIDPRSPRRLSAASQTPWLLRFAGTLGMGISPGAPATSVLLAALKSPHGDERLAALEYLKGMHTDAVVKELYEAMFGTDLEVREAAFLVLWEMGGSGFKLPDPAEYGLN
jgi:HEAT repeat protein